eukprot:1753504-Pyramimonas_sp.AAC.1
MHPDNDRDQETNSGHGLGRNAFECTFIVVNNAVVRARPWLVAVWGHSNGTIITPVRPYLEVGAPRKAAL